jgi:ATP-dependent helicase HrpB
VPDLPVKQVIPRLSGALKEHCRAVLSAPPGSGKTTLVPLELLQAPWLDGAGILLLEPRRLATRAAAGRMASLLGESVGEQVGYTIRMERKVSSKTRIEVVTEGILTRRLQQDPELKGIGLVIFDEFHERNLHSDLALALSLDAQQGLRDDLRLLVMSATLDQQRVSRLMDSAPVIEADSRQYPVVCHYLGLSPDKRRIAEQVVQAVVEAWQKELGDLLVFLPGIGEIKATQKLLHSRFTEACPVPLICPLYGDLPKQDQQRAILPDPQKRRRIVLTTAIAETSLTIEGVGVVVDCGWSRQPRFLPGVGLTRLETVPVSRAAARQRSGRAGRMGPGVCYRVWSESIHAQLPAHHPAEITQADLAPLALQLATWGVADPDQLRWLDAPPQGAYAQAIDLLKRLGALDQQHRLTLLGRHMSALPIHPRLAHMMLNGSVEQRQLVCDLCALLSEKDIFSGQTSESQGCDMELRLRQLRAWRNHETREGFIATACQQVDRVSKEWFRRLQSITYQVKGEALSLGQLLALAFPDRIAQRTDHGRYRLVSGRAARLTPSDPLAGDAYLVAPQLDAGQNEGRIRLAVGIGIAEIRSLPESSIEQIETISWDKKRQRVTAFQEERLGALILTSKPLSNGNPQAVQAAMLEGVQSMGLEVLPWKKPIRQWQGRVCWLAQQLHDPSWPDVSDLWLAEHTEQWLAPWLENINSREQLQKLDLMAILLSMLSWDQQQCLKRLAPTHLQVPSGSKIPLRYSTDKAPVLAVRLQELFGLSETPRICRGRVPVTIHLLSPAQRPIQVTNDLAGFWKRTYSEVKKELKGRYPKHFWPDDPLLAEATHRVRPNRR